ncbi:2-polyprenyl-6-methoxyphenol hydroxylase-like FAD-dependent oxidoreductase [Kribbella aluminosa]|uniref:2-polyprenyl-6-methoxyphenol hydroxylase-like FAD-dependent oxidoreductase n=1 Tax=Kribbella aluminosa TaxID=416017 RepID=A0ABS4UXB7_9ACTN|nr:NAD(P)/FAD-dependent oxidoreductase [Kribbella aluminosa]MBP2356275.1 2-polyprenyl-6-methoxyphenol hydroxylase-like FAD-dependent oxidoreductase [Kribbella aluminosa]
MKVLVIGGGTGGLALAHGLLRAGIEVAVFERDALRTDGLHGYRVGIDPDGSRALHSLLPPELYDTFVATKARDPKYFNMLTEDLKEVLSMEVPPSTEPVESEKSISRMTLRQVLLTGLEDVVEFGKEFTRFEQYDDHVTAYFADGTEATGDLLVAADGSGSRVRRQYLPQAKTEETGIVALAGKLPITDESAKLVSPKVFEGISMINAPRGLFCIIHVMEFQWDRDGHVKHGIGGNTEELIRRWPGLQFDNTRDYINWGLSATRDKLPANIMELTGDELIKVALDLTPDWHPNLRRLFELTDRSTCFPVNIWTSVPVEPWESTNVTLIGDAIHTMTPGRGVGANTALRDAVNLCRALIDVRDGRRELVAAVREYETKMIEYGFDAVIKSRAQMTADDPVHKPVIGRLALAGMRTALRTVNHVPPLKRRMRDSMLAYRGADRDETALEISPAPAGR